MTKPLNPPFTFRAEIWKWSGKAAWHFLSVPKKTSSEIRTTFRGLGRGFGSLPVVVTIGASTWATSIFPDSKRGLYLLPIKKSILSAEHLRSGDIAKVAIEIQVHSV